jgi:hypothetical protein
MTYPIRRDVILSPDQKVHIPLVVRGIWVDDHIESVSVMHGHEYLKMSKHFALIDAARMQAEKEMNEYLDDQEETRDDIIARLCGTR